MGVESIYEPASTNVRVWLSLGKNNLKSNYLVHHIKKIFDTTTNLNRDPAAT